PAAGAPRGLGRPGSRRPRRSQPALVWGRTAGGAITAAGSGRSIPCHRRGDGGVRPLAGKPAAPTLLGGLRLVAASYASLRSNPYSVECVYEQRKRLLASSSLGEKRTAN